MIYLKRFLFFASLNCCASLAAIIGIWWLSTPGMDFPYGIKFEGPYLPLYVTVPNASLILGLLATVWLGKKGRTFLMVFTVFIFAFLAGNLFVSWKILALAYKMFFCTRLEECIAGNYLLFVGVPAAGILFLYSLFFLLPLGWIYLDYLLFRLPEGPAESTSDNVP